MNIIDSSAWLEYFADTKHANKVAPYIEGDKALIVPSICVYEVFRKVLRDVGESEALRISAHMTSHTVIDIDTYVSLQAAKIGLEKKLAMVDSCIYVIAQLYSAKLITFDKDFKGLKNVVYFSK